MQTVLCKEFPVRKSYLRYVMINCLLLGPERTRELCDCVQNDRPIPVASLPYIQKTEFQTEQRAEKTYFSDRRLRDTVRSGFTPEIYAILEARIFAKRAQRYLIRDIQDDQILHRMVEAVYPSFGSREGIQAVLEASFLQDDYCGLMHARVWPLDIYAAALDVSVLQLNRLFTSKYGFVGVSNPVNNFIVKSEFALSRFGGNRSELADFCGKLAAVIHEQLNEQERVSSAEIENRLRTYKVYQLNQQPYLNPIQRYVEYLFDKKGFSYTKRPIQCMLGAIPGIPGRMKRIEEVFQVRKGNSILWVKCIAGYDGVKDKTREMAARARLLRYETPSAQKRTVRMVFVYDGDFTEDLQRLLSLSGWDDIVSVFSFDAYLDELE